ncbi:hypothetical protein K469DRAFT_674710 [Zopfia rhizophila CBS 207.26]|uniref:Uncharacterized protein n=1 Tax=Zopfia rhizophila CBS 207.26 TaxID=1314779 RepID=A0A6A6DHU6_9PEZI|nr:hypothetical protein K469DRAFT_674710 [Zopfia rhizophila CBS 207.26]
MEIRAKVHWNLNRFQAKVIAGEIGLQDVVGLTKSERIKVVQDRPYMDVFLGSIRLYKRVSKVLLYSFCPDIGRFIEPCDGRFIVRLPHGITNALAMKLAVLYMEEYTLDPYFRATDWKVRGDIAPYMDLAHTFSYIGMQAQADQLNAAIFLHMRKLPMRVNQIRGIWGRENRMYPSQYAEAMADNILTFSYTPEEDPFLRCVFGNTVGFLQDSPMKREYSASSKGSMSTNAPDTFSRMYSSSSIAMSSPLSDVDALEKYLDDPYNVALKQLVWTANTFPKVTPHEPEQYLVIMTLKRDFPLNGRVPGQMEMRILLQQKGVGDFMEDCD